MFKKMTKLSILLILILTLGLTACSSQTESENVLVESDKLVVVESESDESIVVESEESTVLTVIESEPEAEVVSTLADDMNYVVNTAVSTIGWFGDKIVGAAHNGTIEISEGSLIVENGALVSGSIVVDMTTMVNENLSGNDAARLVEHLKAEDFFGVDAYPTATLDILSAEPLGNDQYAVTGDLIIKAITNPIEFVAEVVEENGVITASANTVFDRTSYDISYKSTSIFSGLGDGAINDEVQITVTLVASNSPDA
ncbi:MAG: YceI family protein [Chloroflexi bacterium]|nr:YceI family protein [Chloroflexota bacterium]